jgi:hypothetical protein
VERLRTTLVGLSLTAIDARLETLLESASKKEPSYGDFLLEVMSAEADARKQRCLKTRLQLAHPPHLKTFDQFACNALSSRNGGLRSVPDWASAVWSALYRLISVAVFRGSFRGVVGKRCPAFRGRGDPGSKECAVSGVISKLSDSLHHPNCQYRLKIIHSAGRKRYHPPEKMVYSFSPLDVPASMFQPYSPGSRCSDKG